MDLNFHNLIIFNCDFKFCLAVIVIYCELPAEDPISAYDQYDDQNDTGQPAFCLSIHVMFSFHLISL